MILPGDPNDATMKDLKVRTCPVAQEAGPPCDPCRPRGLLRLQFPPTRRLCRQRSAKDSAQCRRGGKFSFDPWVRKIPWRRK